MSDNPVMTQDAIERAKERSVPMPVYIPFDSVCDGKEIRDGQVVYKIVTSINVQSSVW